MKLPKNLSLLLLFSFLVTTLSSQPLSVGIYSGTSLSDIHGAEISGKWAYKPGSSSGVYADYSFFRIMGIRTGISFSSVYYEHDIYTQVPYEVWDLYGPSSSMIYIPQPEKMDFSFLTFPLELRLSIPSKVQIDLTGGIYYSFVKDYSMNYYISTETLKKKDMGYKWTAAFSYPLPGDFTVALGAAYYTGRTRFLEYDDYRHGHIDFTLGLAYNGFFKGRKEKIPGPSATDSLPSKFSVEYFGGVNLNTNSCEYYPEKYSMNTGFSAGFRLNLRWSQKSSFQTGLSFDRTGYSLNDSSSVYYRYVVEGNPMYYVDTKVGIDYLTIPALLNFYIGRENRFYINTGPWLAFKLNARVTGEAIRGNRTNSEYTVSEISVYDDIDSAVKDTDVGWMAGTGFLIPIGNSSAIDLGISYSRGFNDLLDRSYFDDSTPADTDLSVMKNSTISIHAGITIPVK